MNDFLQKLFVGKSDRRVRLFRRFLGKEEWFVGVPELDSRIGDDRTVKTRSQDRADQGSG